MLDQLLRWVPEHLHQEYLGLLNQIPPHVKRIAVIGETCPAVGYLLKKRAGTWVAGITEAPKPAAMAARILDQACSTRQSLESIPPAHLDAIVLSDLEQNARPAFEWLPQLIPKLQEQGVVFALHGRADYDHDTAADMVTALGAAGFGIYQQWPLSDPAAGALLMAVPPVYNPVLHARALRESGDIEGGYAVLDEIPAIYRSEPASRQTIDLEKLATLADWIARDRAHDVSHLLSRALEHFYAQADENPRGVAAYQGMATCWAAAGDDAMARKLLRSINFVSPDPVTTAQLERVTPAPAREEAPIEAPSWRPDGRMRILFLIHPRPHFGLDALFDGLCTCLGDEHVVEFPWKPTLHGGETEAHRNYPCRFQRRGQPASAAQLAAELRDGAFDVILFGDVEGDITAADVQTIVQARGDTPIFLVDALDQPANFRPLAEQRLGAGPFAGYFKREMLRCVDYGPNAWPVPFAYGVPEEPPPGGAERPYDFFWAGHRRFGQRRLYLETLEARFGWNLDKHFAQAEYQLRMRDSRIGLNCFGMGFDTVRYWELPAHGCMLLSDRLPIRVPFNFQDGVNAVFFEDLPDLLEKTEYYRHHPAETARIAAAGYAHFLAHHTNEARARQVLGWIAACGTNTA